MSTLTAHPHNVTSPSLSLRQLHAMRAGYLLMGIGLVLVKWPLLPDAANLPLYEAVSTCLLTAMSVLAFLGLRHPVKLLPVLLFETLWKALWLALTPAGLDPPTRAARRDGAVPGLEASGQDTAMTTFARV